MNERDTLRVLIAEDEESFLRVLTSVLESTGRYLVYPCESGDEAVAALKNSQFEVIILDYKMPDLTGLNVLQWMHEQKLDTPVIMLTGAGTENIAVEAMKMGAYDYLRKDFFDRDRFPIIVYGVYERYLFKKEKEQNEMGAQDYRRNLAALEVLRTSVSAFAQTADTSLARISSLIDEGEKVLRPFLTAEGVDVVGNHCQQIRRERETIATVCESLISLAKAVYDNYRGTYGAQQAKKQLDADQKAIQSSPT